MVLIVAVGLIAVARLAIGRHWPGADRAVALWRSWKPSMVAYVRGSPATFAYLLILATTTWVLLGLSPDVVHAVLSEHSTNLTQLRANPVRVLIRSAFWVDGYALLVWVALFAVVLAPAERWLGTVRWLVVFATGHVGATLLAAGAIRIAIGNGLAPDSLEGVVDVGVSYGFAAVAALLTYRLPSPIRWIWAGTLVLLVLGAAIGGRTFSDFGHLAAVLIGFAMYPITRSVAVSERATGPIWAVEAGRRRRG